MIAISAVVFTIATLLLTFTAARPHPSPPPLTLPTSSSSPPVGCTDELVAISPCLGYISTEPNNLTDTPTSECCDVLKKAFNSGESNCFCYLIKQPLIFEFPLNQSRVASLPTSVCLETTNYSSLESICSGSRALPPLGSIMTNPIITKPFNSGPVNVKSPSTSLPAGNAENSSTPSSFTPASAIGSPTAEKLAPDSAVGSPTAEKPPPQLKPTRHSSTVRHISTNYYWFLPEALITSAVVIVFTHL